VQRGEVSSLDGFAYGGLGGAEVSGRLRQVHPARVALSLLRVDVDFVERSVGDPAEDRLLVQMQGVIAEYERAKIVERTRRGKLHKLRAGHLLPYSSAAPYGYAIVRVGDGPRLLVVDEVEAAHVRAMYRWVLDDGLSARAVAKRLNAEGVPPRRAALWTQGTIFRTLTNPAYIGRATYNRRVAIEPARPRHPGRYRKQLKGSSRWRPQAEWLWVPIPAIIDEEVQGAVRQALAKHKVLSPRNVQHEYLLRGLVVCGACGACGACGLRMDCAHQARPAQRYEYFYYACRHHDPVETGRAQWCTGRRVRRDDLDAVVWDALVSWIQSPQLLVEEIAAWRTSRDGAGEVVRDLARLERVQPAKAISPHALRHTYAIRAVRVGGNVIAVQKLLGHASVSATQRYLDHSGLGRTPRRRTAAPHERELTGWIGLGGGVRLAGTCAEPLAHASGPRSAFRASRSWVPSSLTARRSAGHDCAR
jgi:site-specific DNA recombinase